MCIKVRHNIFKERFLSINIILSILVTSAGAQQFLEHNNGTLHLKLDLSRGGAIAYLSTASSSRNLINIADEGRYIQQSYYAGKTVDRKASGQSPSWSPWSWNPIQVGDAFRNRAQILSSQKNGNTLYVKCTPMLWDMNNIPAEAEMEQWTTLDNNMLYVRNKITCHRTDNIYGEGIINDQELPAVYPISALSKLYSYFGSAPFTNKTPDNPNVINLSSGFWGRYLNNSVTENWMAFVDNNNWGMGVYNPTCTNFLAGMSGSPGFEASDGSTSYIAPIKKEILNKNSVYEYEYYIIIGTLDEIRSKVYSLHSKHSLREWNFNTDGNSEGWVTTNTVTSNVSSGFNHLTITGVDPFITLTSPIAIDASKYKHLTLRMKNNTTDTHADLFFMSSSASQLKMIRFSIVPNDNIFRDYLVNLGSNTEWNGTITGLRLDPVADVTSGSVAIDYIKITEQSTVIGSFKQTKHKADLLQYSIQAQPGFLKVTGLSEGPHEAAIINYKGIIVKKLQMNGKSHTFKTTDLTCGVYFVKIQSSQVSPMLFKIMN
jgi:hypothetical protein